jgi:hypothetical protein
MTNIDCILARVYVRFPEADPAQNARAVAT